MTQLMTIDGIISAEGSCKVFDSQADGFARADGIAGIFIKPLDAALRDGNPIRVVIRGTGTNSDGRSGTIMMPSAEAQEELMRMTYAEAGLDPHETAYVEVSRPPYSSVCILLFCSPVHHCHRTCL